ncbi:MAG: DUF72 domain-containing protein [Candidatus Acidiferrales bacterium]
MKTIHAGTSGWSYANWRPQFYPEKLAPAKFLAFYATRLNSVEVNYTFRHFPTAKLLNGWISATPPDFQFSLKAPQTITHIRRLRNTSELAVQFVDALWPLQNAKKLGAVLFQLPPNLQCDAGLLKDFLGELPGSTRAAFEFRHESWFCDAVFAELHEANAALCQAESDKLESPDVQTANFSYFRMRKESYPADARSKLATKIRRLAKAGDVFLYFKHEDTPEGALYAEDILRH